MEISVNRFEVKDSNCQNYGTRDQISFRFTAKA